jgi:hypothetical protein
MRQWAQALEGQTNSVTIKVETLDDDDDLVDLTIDDVKKIKSPSDLTSTDDDGSLDALISNIDTTALSASSNKRKRIDGDESIN